MKFIITESKMINVMRKYLEMEFPGFSNIEYNWADFNCGMGVCCDPYAVGFTLPGDNYDNYLFKLVNGEKYDDDGDYPEELKGDLPEPCYEQPNIQDPSFDTIIISEDMYERIEQMFGSHVNWGYDFLNFLNKRFDINVKTILMGYW
jgi:hypothetical protein